MDVDVDDGGRNASGALVKISEANGLGIMQDCPVGDSNHGEEIEMHAANSSEDMDTEAAEITSMTRVHGESLISQLEAENGMLSDKKKGPSEQTDVSVAADSRRPIMNMDMDDAICMRTRARYSLASFTLDELETFLQEADDEDDLHNVDDEEEYRKFLAAVLHGRDDNMQNLQDNENIDDEYEDNDADFELELEEALESEAEENTKDDSLGRRPKTRQNRRQRCKIESGKKLSGRVNRPLRPLLPVASLGCSSAFDGKCLLPTNVLPHKPPGHTGIANGFTPHQIGQLHCQIHEHVQLLIQIFSVSALEPGKNHIASEVRGLISDILFKREEALAWRRLPHPSFYFCPPYIHPSVQNELPKTLSPQCTKDVAASSNLQQDRQSCNSILSPNGQSVCLPDERAGYFQNPGCSSWAPFINGPVMSVLDVAPLRLVGHYIDEVSSVMQAYERRNIGVGFDGHSHLEPLFPLHNFQCAAEPDGQVLNGTASSDSATVLSSSARSQVPKKTMAATLVEKAKKQSVAFVPREIAQLAQRFYPLFNSALYPHKPPPASVANRVLFTDAEDELLAMGLMEYNTDWKSIQQRFLPCKSKHQIFIRQKNRSSSKAPENPIKAVRRMKNSPLTAEEIARIQEGLKIFKLDWYSVWRSIVPYRDPTLLPRQWRIALGTQKSYKSDANKKAKRRLYESKRRACKTSIGAWHSPSEKEDGIIDNGMEESNSGDNRMDREDEAYVHEAFLADWRPETSNISMKCPTERNSQDGSQVKEQMNTCGSVNAQLLSGNALPAASRSSHSQVFLRPYRARRVNNRCVVKLAPDLPPVNLPPSVRIMSQSAFKSLQGGIPAKVSGTGSSISGTVAESAAPKLEYSTKSRVDHTSKSGQIGNSSGKKTPNQYEQRCANKERDDSDLQMHPLLFRAPEDGRFAYYPLNYNSSTVSSFSLFTGSQPQLNLSLFHNPRHVRDAVNFLAKSSNPAAETSSSPGVHFHPLLQRTNYANSDLIDARSSSKLPSDADSRHKGALVKNPFSAPMTEGGGSVDPSPRHYSPCRKANELDLEIQLSCTSRNQKAAESRSTARYSIDRSVVNVPNLRTPESGNPKDSRKYLQRDPSPDKMNKVFELGANSHTPRNEVGGRDADDAVDQSLSEIVMEQEELSDSEDEFGENVEFEHEEMTDSGDGTSESEQFVDTLSKEAAHEDGREPDFDDQHSSLSLLDESVGTRSSSLCFSLDSYPQVYAPTKEKHAGIRYDFGPFGITDDPAPSKHTKNNPVTSGEDASKMQEQPTLRSGRNSSRNPRKRACPPDES